MLCGIFLKLTIKTLEQCGIDIVLRSSLLTLNTFRKAFGLLIRCFFSFLGMHLSVSSKHLPVQRQQRHLKNKNTKTMSMFLFWCLWACHFSIYFTPFFSVSIVGFQQVSVCWIGTFFSTGITKCINSLCKTIEL